MSASERKPFYLLIAAVPLIQAARPAAAAAPTAPTKAAPAPISGAPTSDSPPPESPVTSTAPGSKLVGVWTLLVGPLSPNDETQLEERLRRVPGPSNGETPAPPAQVSRLAAGIPRPGSPVTTSRNGGIPRPASPASMKPLRSASPVPLNLPRAGSPVRTARVPIPNSAVPSSPTTLVEPFNASAPIYSTYRCERDDGEIGSTSTFPDKYV
ncbi:hypothetical protein K438DRAFT_1985138 [Mycena galopus ATCC 62051]|nr:hypothetical protein K438DRAFT_1985138 [Mycena galopus ATCC 62051]